MIGITGFIAAWLTLPEEGGQAFDRWAHNLLGDLKSEAVTSWMEGFSYLGATYTIILITISAAAIFGFQMREGWRYSVLLIGGMLVGYVLNTLLKGWIERVRPATTWGITADGASFPSGNAMLGIILFGLIIVIVWRESKLPKTVKAAFCVVLALLILLMGICRVYFHVHYVTDVLAGYSAGLAVLCAAVLLGDTLYRRSKER